MKLSLVSILMSLIVCQVSASNLASTPEFSSSQDTLIIRTQKQKGSGLFELGAGFPRFQDISEDFPYTLILPQGLSDITRTQIYTDFRAEKHHFVDVIKGIQGGKEVFVVDQNNNNDLTDDPIRLVEPMEWYAPEALIKCQFLVSNGQEIIKDSSWLRMGVSHGSFASGRSENLKASFKMDDVPFELGVVDKRNAASFTYSIHSEIALISHDSEERDSLFMKDIMGLGEFVKLNKNYYRFESISNNGEYITLVKEKNFEKKIGTQVGMIAPEFTSVSTAGDTIQSAVMKDKITVITNSCGCGGDKQSTQAYFNMKERYGDKINLLRLDSAIDPKLEGTHIDMENDFNKDMYTKYRGMYCSRTSYVIDENKRIIDKFFVLDWEAYMSAILLD